MLNPVGRAEGSTIKEPGRRARDTSVGARTDNDATESLAFNQRREKGRGSYKDTRFG